MAVDWLSIMMLGVVSFLASLIQIYSVGYMRGDNRFWWFFTVMSLFCAAMLGLVLAYDFLLMYMCWELVGLCSFLLIGFWYQERDNAEAAKKAFITTRVGDVGFFIGIALLFLQTDTFRMDEIFAQIERRRDRPHDRDRRRHPGLHRARWGRAGSSRCTSGCRTPWPARRRSRPWCIRRRWSRPGVYLVGRAYPALRRLAGHDGA